MIQSVRLIASLSLNLSQKRFSAEPFFRLFVRSFVCFRCLSRTAMTLMQCASNDHCTTAVEHSTCDIFGDVDTDLHLVLLSIQVHVVHEEFSAKCSNPFTMMIAVWHVYNVESL